MHGAGEGIAGSGMACSGPNCLVDTGAGAEREEERDARKEQSIDAPLRRVIARMIASATETIRRNPTEIWIRTAAAVAASRVSRAGTAR